MSQQTLGQLHDVFPERSGGIWSNILVSTIFITIYSIARGEVVLGLVIAIVGCTIAVATRSIYLSSKKPLELHLQRLSKLPFEVHGYLQELVEYEDKKAEYIRSGDQLATHITINFTQPDAQDALAAEVWKDLPNGAELRVVDASSIVFIQHKLMIIGERWDDPKLDTNPLKMVAGAAYRYRVERGWYYGGPLAEFKKKLPLQKWFMKFIGIRLEPLHQQYPIRSVHLDLVVEQ